MDDRWQDRLSEYVDGELSAVEQRELEAHLGRCAGCSATLEDLRQVVRAAASLPDVAPAGDLWAGIEARLAPRSTAAPAASARTGSTPVISLAGRRRFAFTLPQLAAASVALVAFSSGLVWLLVSRPGAPVASDAGRAVAVATPALGSVAAATPATGPASAARGPDAAITAPAGGAQVPTAGSPAAASSAPRAGARAPVQLVRAGGPDARATRAYDRAVADLQAVLRNERGRLRPETIAALEASLAQIDQAIADARRALARDPADVYLNAHLAQTMQLKVELLREAAALTQS